MKLPDLDKRVSDMTGDELCALVDDLEFQHWLDEERTIQEAADKYVERWRAEQNTPGAFARRMTFAAPRPTVWDSTPKPPATLTYTNIVVDIPPYIPIEYVRPFAEAMIREQINPEED